jgi:CheY-like chemotaxis protein
MKRTKILLVDDDAKLSALVRVILERMGGYEVREENRSFAALATAREYLPDLVILDVNMPGKDGGDVAAELRSDYRLAGTPVVFLTSLVTARDSGMRGGRYVLAKPVEPYALLKAVRDLVPAGAA